MTERRTNASTPTSTTIAANVATDVRRRRRPTAELPERGSDDARPAYAELAAMTAGQNPFGDGRAAERIAEHLLARAATRTDASGKKASVA